MAMSRLCDGVTPEDLRKVRGYGVLFSRQPIASKFKGRQSQYYYSYIKIK